MPVFPISQPPDSRGRFELSEEDGHHLQKVLRLKSGDSFEVSLPDGSRGPAVLQIEKGRAHGHWLGAKTSEAPATLPLWLGIGLIRWPRMEWLVEKATELGLARFSPLRLTQGRLSKNDEISPNKIERLRKISKETLKQCERNALMQIDEPQDLQSFLERLPGETEARRVLLRERLKSPSLAQVWERTAPSWILLVGPEGGFSAEELALAEAAGFRSASLGPTILRSETAALVAISRWHFRLYEEGDIR